MKKLIVVAFALSSLPSFASSPSHLKVVRTLCDEIYWVMNSNNAIKGYDCLAKGVDLVEAGAKLKNIVIGSCEAGYDFYNTAYSARKCFNKGLDVLGTEQAQIIKTTCGTNDSDTRAVECIATALRAIP